MRVWRLAFVTLLLALCLLASVGVQAQAPAQESVPAIAMAPESGSAATPAPRSGNPLPGLLIGTGFLLLTSAGILISRYQE